MKYLKWVAYNNLSTERKILYNKILYNKNSLQQNSLQQKFFITKFFTTKLKFENAKTMHVCMPQINVCCFAYYKHCFDK